MPFLRNGSADLYYETHGEGPPVVFAHGAGGNTVIWWQQVPHFAARYHSLPDIGHSTDFEAPDEFNRLAGDFAGQHVRA